MRFARLFHLNSLFPVSRKLSVSPHLYLYRGSHGYAGYFSIFNKPPRDRFTVLHCWGEKQIWSCSMPPPPPHLTLPSYSTSSHYTFSFQIGDLYYAHYVQCELSAT